MSALVNIPGFFPTVRDLYGSLDGGAPAFTSTAVIDAAAEKAAVIGEVWHPTVKTGTINIRKVHFRCGAVTFNVNSVLQVSLQDVSLTAGPPYQPDGTADQTVAMTTLSANAWNTTGNLSADRAVNLANDSIGDANSRWLAIVWEYTTFTLADSVVISVLGAAAGAINPQGSLLGSLALLNTGSWALVPSTWGVVALECNDGTFAFLRNCMPFSSFGNASVASDGAIRRAGVMFQVPVQLKIDCLSMHVNIPNGCDGRFVLYDSDGTTELVSVLVDNDAVSSATSGRTGEIVFAPVTLEANTNYRFAFVADTITAALVYYGDVNTAGLMDGLVLGQNAHWTEHDGAAWTQTTTRRPHFGFSISAVHDGAIAGRRSGNMRGGMQA